MSIKGPSNKTYIPIWYSLFKYKYGQKKHNPGHRSIIQQHIVRKFTIDSNQGCFFDMNNYYSFFYIV